VDGLLSLRLSTEGRANCGLRVDETILRRVGRRSAMKGTFDIDAYIVNNEQCLVGMGFSSSG